MIGEIRALALAGLMVLSIVTAGVAIPGDAAAAGNTDAAIDGTITDAVGDPVDTGEVRIWNGEDDWNATATDDAGGYSVGAVDGNTYDVDFYQRDASVTYPNDGVVDFWALDRVTAPSQVDERLPDGHVLNVTVANESGDPVGDARVSVIQTDGDRRISLVGSTNANGALVTGDDPGVEVNGSVRVFVDPPSGRDLLHQSRALTVDADTDLAVALPETVNASGRIALANGSASSTDQIQWRARGDESHVATEFLDASDGSYEVQVLQNTTYAVQYRQSPPRSSASTVYPTDGSPDVYSVDETSTGASHSRRLDGLPAGSNLSVRVVDENGDPVSDVSLAVSHHDDGVSTTLTAQTNANGYGEHPDSDGPGFELAGDVEIRARPPDGSNFESNATRLSVSESQTVEIVLTRSNNVSGQWVGPDGDPVSASRVDAFNYSMPLFDRGETDADGYFDLTLPDGTYTITVDAQTPNDGVADHAAVDGVSVDGDTDVGMLTVPRGYNVTLDAVDQRGRTVDAHVHACDYDAYWCYEYGTGRDLDNPYDWANAERREIADGTVQVDVYDSWTNDRLGGGNVTVDGAPVSETLSVDRLNGTDVPDADGFSVVRDLESERFASVEWLLRSDVNVRLWTLNSTESTSATVAEELPDGYELNETYGVVADGPGSISGVDYDAGSNALTFELNGTVTQVRYRIRPTDGGRDSAVWSGTYSVESSDAEVDGERAIPASAAPVPSESDDGTDGGSGGGGGGAPPQNLEDPLGTDAFVSTTLDGATVSVVRGEIGGSATADLPSTAAAAGVTFDELGVTLAADEEEFELGVAVSDEVPENVSPPADRTALGYLSVEKEGVDNDAIANATVGFHVDEAVLPEGASLDDVRLYHYEDGEWTALPTERNGTSFAAETDGFSTFAVGVAAPDVGVTAASVETDEIEVGGSVTVTATVANDGSLDGNRTVAVTAGGATLASANVTVAAGETRTVEFDVTLDDPGTVDFAVAGVDAGSVEVSAAATETTADTESTASEDADTGTDSDGQPGFDALAALVALVAGALLARRGR